MVYKLDALHCAECAMCNKMIILTTLPMTHIQWRRSTQGLVPVYCRKKTYQSNETFYKQTKSFKFDATPPDTKGTYTVAPPTVVDLTLGPHYNNRSCKLAMVSYLNGC